MNVTFEDWTKGRTVATLGTNTGSVPLPFQQWRNFKEAFAPELIARAVAESPLDVQRVIDPFGGSGTTALAAQFLGKFPTTIEVNPYLADLIEAKIGEIDLDSSTALLGDLVERVATSDPFTTNPFPGAPDTFVQPGKKGRFIFWRDVANRIAAYRDAISEIPDPAVARLFRVVLASGIIAVSNVRVSGKGRRYRGGWKNKKATPIDVDRYFQSGVSQALYDLHRYSRRSCTDYALLRGDARREIEEVDEFELAVFSPPYPNSFDYTDVYNVELWAAGYLDNKDANTRLRNNTLRSHVQIRRDMTCEGLDNQLLQETVERLDEAADKLWHDQIPAMIGAYFFDMAGVIDGLARKLHRSGRIYMVVGDSRYAGIDVPVAKILAQLAPSSGLTTVSVEPFRSMRASPQQGGQKELGETLLVLKKH